MNIEWKNVFEMSSWRWFIWAWWGPTGPTNGFRVFGLVVEWDNEWR